MRILLLIALLLLLVLVVGVGCRSLSRSDVETRVRLLKKNQPLSAHTLSERRVDAVLAGQALQLRLRWYRLGPERSEQPPIVFVHGTPAVAEHWTELTLGAGGLATDRVVYLLELIGHGYAPDELAHTSFQACADHVRVFLESLDLRNVTLVGHSYGGEFAWRCALDAPERVGRLVLIDSSGPPRRDGEWMSEEEKMRDWSIARYGWIASTPERVESALAIHFPGPIPEDRLEEMYLACAHRKAWEAMVELCRDENGERFEELARWQGAVTLIWGEQDIAYRPERFLKEFERVLPQAQTVLIAGAGHYPHEVFPRQVADAIR